ncbi:MAG: ABC transporter permease [Acidobacteria bacterium]|nr:ABC transporter permease [Acidobacteriota bacterium]
MVTSNIRHALRMLRLNPGFAAAVVITLSLGIGATTAMFTVVDGVILKSLPYPDASRLAAINTRFTDSGRSIWRTAGGDLEDLRGETSSFEALTSYFGGEVGVQLSHSAEFAGAWWVDPDFFRVFSFAPVAGRTFTPADAARAAIVSAGFARRNFASPAAALNQTIRVEGVAYEIVGVMPPVFDFPRQAQVWLAVSAVPENRNRDSYNYRVAAKLKPEVSPAAANARLQALGNRLAAAYPRENKNKTFVATPLQEEIASPVRFTMLTLMGAVGMVLLIACANVANLMLARATVRSRELSLRAALGASRGRLIGQMLAESMALGTIAAVMGIGLAAWGTQALLHVGSKFVPGPLVGRIGIDLRVLLFAVAASAITSVVFTLAPAWQATRLDLQEALRQGGTRGLVGGGDSKLRNSLVVGQIALSLTLAVGAGLLIRTMAALYDAQLGYRTQGILVAYAHDPAHTLPEALSAGRFFDDLFVRLRQLPGVISAAGAMGLPGGDYGSNGGYGIAGEQPGNQDMPFHADFSLAGPGYFETLGIPLLRGRDFTQADLYDLPLVAIVSQSLARQTFGNDDPIGRRIFCGLDDYSMKGMTIVGVVGDVRQDSPAELPGPDLYMPLRQHPFYANQIEVVVRTTGNPESYIPAVQNTFREMNPQVALRFTTLNDVVRESISAQRFRMALVSTFAALALLLAISGMYAVMSYVAARRVSEFGLRSALGAQPGDIVRLVLGGAARLAALGLMLGIALSVAASRLIRALLFGLGGVEPGTYATAAAMVFAAILLAAAVPAWRAARVDPMIALRNE